MKNKYRKFSEELKKCNSITQKLNYLFKEYNSSWVLTVSNNSFLNFLKHFDADHFKECNNVPEYTFWLLNFMAHYHFDRFINQDDFQSILTSDTKKDELQEILEEINSNEKMARSQKVNIYKKLNPNALFWTFYSHIDFNEDYAIEVRRILRGNYYKENAADLSKGYGSSSVHAYFRHRLLKPYLKDELNKYKKRKRSNKETQSIENNNTNLSKDSNINVFCNSMPLNIPKEHFEVFINKTSNNGKPYLTKEQFSIFIDKAFCGKEDLLKQKFNQIPKGEKLLIQNVFYDFYNTYCMDYFNTMQNRDIFIKLLTNNFIGWDFQNVKNNFRPKTKNRL